MLPKVKAPFEAFWWFRARLSERPVSLAWWKLLTLMTSNLVRRKVPRIRRRSQIRFLLTLTR